LGGGAEGKKQLLLGFKVKEIHFSSGEGSENFTPNIFSQLTKDKTGEGGVIINLTRERYLAVTR